MPKTATRNARKNKTKGPGKHQPKVKLSRREIAQNKRAKQKPVSPSLAASREHNKRIAKLKREGKAARKRKPVPTSEPTRETTEVKQHEVETTKPAALDVTIQQGGQPVAVTIPAAPEP